MTRARPLDALRTAAQSADRANAWAHRQRASCVASLEAMLVAAEMTKGMAQFRSQFAELEKVRAEVGRLRVEAPSVNIPEPTAQLPAFDEDAAAGRILASAQHNEEERQHLADTMFLLKLHQRHHVLKPERVAIILIRLLALRSVLVKSPTNNELAVLAIASGLDEPIHAPGELEDREEVWRKKTNSVAEDVKRLASETAGMEIGQRRLEVLSVAQLNELGERAREEGIELDVEPAADATEEGNSSPSGS